MSHHKKESVVKLHQRATAAVAIACLSSLALNACGDDDNKSSSTGSSSETILVGGMAPLTSEVYTCPECKGGLEAAIGRINKDGGINGKKLELEFCDTKFTAAGEVNCARSLVRDKVSAVLAPNAPADGTGSVFKVFEQAKTPVIGGFGNTPAELESDVAFPLSAGLPGWEAGAVSALTSQGVTKIGLIVDNNPSSAYSAELIKDNIKNLGGEFTADLVTDPTSDPTFATVAGKAVSSGAQGLVLGPTPGDFPKVVKALNQAGYKGKLSAITAILPPVIIEAMGPLAEGLLVTSQLALPTDTANPGVAKYLADINEFSPDTIVGEFSQFGWGATNLFAAVAETTDNYDAPSILTAMTELEGPVDLGITGPYSVKGNEGIPGFARIFNPTVSNGVIKDGVIQPDGKGIIKPF